MNNLSGLATKGKELKINKGDLIETPRFLQVRIEDVLTETEAREQGYTEPTHYKNAEYKILGKHIGINRMVFAAVAKEEK